MQSLVDILESFDDRPDADAPDALLSALTAEILLLAEEVCVARDRFDVALELAYQGRDVTERNVDDYDVSAVDVDKRLATHTAFYDQIFARLTAAIGSKQPSI